MISKQCLTIKHPCKYCLQSVTQRNGLQCRGACKKWAHYKCLNYTPGKISDIKSGVIQVLCPCIDCESTSPKEVLVDPPFICDNTRCPAHRLPMCESPDCPSKHTVTEPPLNKQRVKPCESDDSNSQRLNIQPYQPENCFSDPEQSPTQSPCYVDPYNITLSPVNSNTSLTQPSNAVENCSELKANFMDSCPLQPCPVKSCSHTPRPCVQKVNSKPCIPQQCPARTCPLHNKPPHSRRLNPPELSPMGKNPLHMKTMPSCPIPAGQCMDPDYRQTECGQVPTCVSRQRNSESSSLVSCDGNDSPQNMTRTLSDSQMLEQRSSMTGHIRDINCTLDKLATQMKFLMEKMERQC